MEDGLCLNKSVIRALRVMRFRIHSGLKTTPFELHHDRKPRTELTNIVKDGKTYLSNWSDMTVSAAERSNIPVYVGRDEEGEIINHIIMAKTKNEEKQTDKELKQKINKREVPRQITNRNKRNREYRKN